jgi:hypothetical protein
MEVETLGVARSMGWKVHMRCANGYRQETRSMRKCVYRNRRPARGALYAPRLPWGSALNDLIERI